MLFDTDFGPAAKESRPPNLVGIEWDLVGGERRTERFRRRRRGRDESLLQSKEEEGRRRGRERGGSG